MQSENPVWVKGLLLSDFHARLRPTLAILGVSTPPPPQAMPLNRELVKGLRSQVCRPKLRITFIVHDLPTIIIHSPRCLQIEDARRTGKVFDEGKLLVFLSRHFADCHMFPLAAKMLEESLVALRRTDMPNRHSVLIVLDTLADLSHTRCQCAARNPSILLIPCLCTRA